MPSRSPKNRLADIITNIDLARSFVREMSFESFCADRRTVYAVVRCLEIISEASRRLPDTIKQRHPEIPWGQVAGAGNVYRHDYQVLNDRIVWQSVQVELEPLLSAARQEMVRLQEKQ